MNNTINNNLSINGSGQPLLLNKREAAKALRISERSLQTWERAGKITAVRIGGRVLFDPDDLRTFIARQKVVTGAMAA